MKRNGPKSEREGTWEHAWGGVITKDVAHQIEQGKWENGKR
jgi:hypothetical protein